MECVRCGSYTTIGHEHYCEPEPLRELPYTPDPGYPEPERIGPPHDHPERRELVDWKKGRLFRVWKTQEPLGHQEVGLWRGYVIRVFPGLYPDGNVCWYGEVDGVDRAHWKPSKEAAQEAACGWVDSELGL